ncbi:MAG: excinuclease ABC subunit UvrA [Flavobacteriales bacterium]
MSKEEVISEQEFIEVYGARAHNLKNLSVSIPRNKLVVITGLSGSGKSSLAFDTIFAEGQRRYIETFSSYARQFLGGMERPDVDKITGLSPVISIEQKTVNRNPRSTVGTITEVYDFLRLFYARASDAYSYATGKKMVKYSESQILELILKDYLDKKVIFLAPVVKARKGHYRELFEQIRKQGYSKVRVDGEVKDLVYGMQIDRYKIHDIEVVVDRLTVSEEHEKRMVTSLRTALKVGKGVMMVMDYETSQYRNFSRFLMCPDSGISYSEPEPNLFSFNSPYGACHKCNGLGKISQTDLDKVIPDSKLSIKKGGIAPLGKFKPNLLFRQVEAILKKYNYTLDTPLKEIDETTVNRLLFGSDDYIKYATDSGLIETFTGFEGIVAFVSRHFEETESRAIHKWAEAFMNEVECTDCEGSRLKKEALFFKIDEKNIFELASMDIQELKNWFQELESRLNEKQRIIANDILKEIRARLAFLLDVGLDYLTLDRSAKTLSGGEAQRIRLATQIGSQLTGVLYILDEPSIGLHQRDNSRLIDSLKKLRDAGNSVLVVEHDKEMIESSDYLIDIGPGAGVNGGEIVTAGIPARLAKSDSVTAKYLTGKMSIAIPKTRRKGNGNTLTLKGATGNNLKNITVDFPLETFICVTGVSGSGKSTLINETLFPILHKELNRAQKEPMKFKSIQGLEFLDKVIQIDQSPIGRTPRSNPATYTGVFSDIRDLFTLVPESKIRGYQAGRFSFNVKGGRCETCKGAGLKVIEMNFLPDVSVPCETCNGKRYNRETLEIRYKGKSISDVLDMTIDDAVQFFENIPSIYEKLITLHSVGLAYVTLGQQSTTLSGGEAQRVKLATELSKKETGRTFYILDEPTTGLHFEDIRLLLEVLNRLVNNGNTVLVIEHNLDIIKVADYIVDIGPEGGSKGGELICAGTPEQVAINKHSYTGKYLKEELKKAE